MRQNILLAVLVCLSTMAWAGIQAKAALWLDAGIQAKAALWLDAGGGPLVGNPIQKGRLTIYPVTGPALPTPSHFMTLDEGLEAGTVKVGELGSLEPRMMRTPAPRRDSGQVNELALVNHSNRPLILLAGEVVSGGKQDRVVAQDRIVPPHSAPVPLGVFCVEPGRWRGLSMEFAAAKLMAHPELRKQAMVAQDQEKVWAEVAKSRTEMAVTVGSAMAASGASSSYAVAAKSSPVEHRVMEDVSGVMPQLPDNAMGMVVAVDGRMVWADLFPNAALFRRYRDKLLQSYVVESYRAGTAPAAPPSVEEAAKFLRAKEGRQNIQVEPGLYRLARTEADGTVTYELEALGQGENGLRLHFARMLK